MPIVRATPLEQTTDRETDGSHHRDAEECRYPYCGD